jgi:tagaturonate reductase
VTAELPRLSRALVSSAEFSATTTAELPPVAADHLPERIVQFGTGGLLRGLVDFFVDQAIRRGQFDGRVVMIGSTRSGRDLRLNAQDGLFTLAERGREDGVAVERYRVIASVSRAISADDWGEVLALARSPEVRLVVSNTTEIGITLDIGDSIERSPPRSFPGKLTAFLFERARSLDFGAGGSVVVLPCELIEHNGTRLREIVLTVANGWKLDARFAPWLREQVVFCDTLVDRIVTGTPPDREVDVIQRSLGYRDEMITACEPYRLFAIKGDETVKARLGFADADPAIVVQPDIEPYRLRKVRILNGAHTIMVPLALLAGLETVAEAMDDRRVGAFVHRAIFDEIVPSLRVPDAKTFGSEVIDRFRNPFIRHALTDIALHSTTKMRVRVVPSILAYTATFGRAPAALSLGFAAFLLFLRGDLHAGWSKAGKPIPLDPAGDPLRRAWTGLDAPSETDLRDLVTTTCSDVSVWGNNLCHAADFTDIVAEYIVLLVNEGPASALDALLSLSTQSH